MRRKATVPPHRYLPDTRGELRKFWLTFEAKLSQYGEYTHTEHESPDGITRMRLYILKPKYSQVLEFKPQIDRLCDYFNMAVRYNIVLKEIHIFTHTTTLP